MQIVVEAILSYPSLGKPAKNIAYPDNPPQYKADFIMTEEEAQPLLDELAARIKEDHKGKTPRNIFLKETDIKVDKETGLPCALYKDGAYFMTATSGKDQPPMLLSPQAKPGYPPQNYKGGNRVKVAVNVYSSIKYSTVSAGLQAVQWLSDGDTSVSPSVNLNAFSSVEPSEFKLE